MKRGGILLVCSLLLLALIFVGQRLASAQNFRSGNNVTVPAGQKVDSTLFAAGSQVDVAGEVNGDIFCAGQNINISGKVHGDVICAGQTIHIDGTVDGDVRLAGQTVSIGGSVANNATIAAQNFTLEQAGKIGDDLSFAASSAFINGPVGRDVFGSARTIEISSSIGQDVKVNVNKLTFDSTAKVGGSVDYRSNNDAQVDQGASVTNLKRTTPPPSHGFKWQIFGFALFITLLMIAALFVVSLVLVLLFPGVFRSATDKTKSNPWRVLLTGVIAAIAVPIILLALTLTVIGIPLAILFGLAWILVVFLAGPFFSFWLGRSMLRDGQNAILIMLLGVAVVMLAYLIPIIGFLMALAVYFMGTGIVVHELLSHFKRPHYHVQKAAVRGGNKK